MTSGEQTKGHQKITDKVLSLLEWLDKKTPDANSYHVLRVGDWQIRYIEEIRRRLDEISLEAFAEINKEAEDINP